MTLIHSHDRLAKLADDCLKAQRSVSASRFTKGPHNKKFCHVLTLSFTTRQWSLGNVLQTQARSVLLRAYVSASML